MAEEQAKLVITAENKTDAAFRAIQQAMGGLSKSAGQLQAVLGTLGVGVGFAEAVAMIGRATIASEQSVARLTAALRAAGLAGREVSDQMTRMRASLTGATFFNEEDIRNAQAQLVKFGNIYGENFERALKLSADLAAMMGTDLPSAAQTLGRAVASPTHGTQLLQRMTGALSDEIRAEIKTLEDQGETYKAGALLLDELQRKIGGTAEVMNTGLKKATAEMAKEWSHLLETIGHTEAAQKAGKGFIDFLTQSMKDLEQIITRGDWVEKMLAIMAFAGGWRGIKLGGPAEPGPTATGTIKQPPRMPTKGEASAGFPLTDTEYTDWNQRYLEIQKKAEAERIREWEREAQAFVDVEDQAAQDAAEAWQAYDKITLETERQRMEDQAKMWSQVFDTIDQEQQQAMDDGAAYLDDMGKKSRETASWAREFGQTFTSGFEDAIVKGKEFGEIIAGIGEDIARLILRMKVEKPFLEWLLGAEGSSGGGALGSLWSAVGSYFMGAQHGADFTVGGSGPADSHLIAFRATPGERVTVTPPGHEGGSPGLTLVQHISVDARSDISSVRAAMAAAKQEALAELERSLYSGGRFARAAGKV